MNRSEEKQKRSQMVYIAIFLATSFVLAIWMREGKTLGVKWIISIVVLMIFFLMTTLLVEKLQQENDMRNSYFLRLFITSPFVFFAVFYSTNLEMISVFLFLLGVINLYKKKNNCVFIYFVLAIGLNYFYLILYIAILLIWEKKIKDVFFRIVTVGICGILMKMLLVYILPKEIEMGNILWIDTISKGFPGIAGKNVSYLVIVLLVIYFWCYMLAEKKSEYIHYILMVISILMMCFGTFQDYYMVIVIPFMLLVFSKNIQYVRINSILYLVYNVCGLLCMMWNKIELLLQIPYIEYYMAAVSAGLVSSGILICFINYPKGEIIKTIANVKCELWLSIINLLIAYPFIFVIIKWGF